MWSAVACRAISVLTLSQSDVNSHLSPPSKDLGNELVLLAASDVPGLVLQPTDVSASSRGKPIALDEVAHNHRGGTNVAVHLSWLWQVGDTRVGAHQHVHRVETSLEEPGGEEKIRLKMLSRRQTSSLSQTGGSLPGESSEDGCGERGLGSTSPRYGLSPQPTMPKLRLELITVRSETQSTQNWKRLDAQPEGRETSIGSSPPRCSLVSVPRQHKSVRPSTPGC